MRWMIGLCILSSTDLIGQPCMLHFTRTSGYDHNTRSVSYAMFQEIGNELGCTVENDDTGAPFSDVGVLAQYDVIVFSNTSGDAILDAQQRANFETFVANGGHVMGIHAATDTYRHSSANGANTGTWDFYAELLGASVQQDPNHVTGTPQYAMSHIGAHASLSNLPDPWVKNEEYYYWEGGYFAPDNVEVLRVEETVGPNGQVNSYDAPRPMSWYRELTSGSRVFYTALGHEPGNFTSDLQFRAHIRDALSWLMETGTAVEDHDAHWGIRVFPDPADDVIMVETDASSMGLSMVLHDASGRVVLDGIITGGRTTIIVSHLPQGRYAIRVGERTVPVHIQH